MQGDIKLPGVKRSRTAPTPKPPITSQAPEPDFTIDESDIQSAPAAKQRKILIAPHKHFKRFWRWWMDLNRNVRFGVIAGLLLLFGIGAILWFAFIQPSSNPTIAITKHPPKPKPPITVASPLTGLQVAPALAQRPVTGVMIENSDGARPQSGLQDAGVVFEAIAEAGITRFLALYQDAQPQYIGPVRSLRPYYIDYAAQFQASIVHVGGSPDALSEVTSGGFRNLDEFANGGYFWRISSRYAPHNVYTSFAKLDALNAAKGYTHSSFTPWPRQADKKLAVPTAKSIDFKISSPDFYVHYDYNPADNDYLRSEAGAPHMDLISPSDTTGVRLHPKVVIAIVVPQSYGALDSSGAYYTDYQDIGTGAAYIFQDGGVTQATWSKNSTDSMIQFLDSAGNPVPLDAGQAWITLVGSPGLVSYSTQ